MQRVEIGVVVGVGLLEGVREDPQPHAPAGVTPFPGAPGLPSLAPLPDQSPAPSERSAQGEAEMLDRAARDRIDHLLVEVRVRFARLQTSVEEDLRSVQIDGPVVAAVRGVVVDHLDQGAARPRGELALAGHADREEVSVAAPQARVEGVDLQGPSRRDVHGASRREKLFTPSALRS